MRAETSKINLKGMEVKKCDEEESILPLFYDAKAIDSAGETKYLVYTDSHAAIAEVAYSRLARRLKLSCVHAWLAEFENGYISLSEYDPKWVLWDAWSKSEENKPVLKNDSEVDRHYLLRFLMHQELWMPEGAGYVRPAARPQKDGKNHVFIKANNGDAFLIKMFQWTKGKNYRYLDYSITPEEFFLSTQHSSRGYDVIPKMAAVSDEEMQACVSFPSDIKNGEETSEFLIYTMKKAREFAAEILEKMKADASNT